MATISQEVVLDKQLFLRIEVLGNKDQPKMKEGMASAGSTSKT